LVGLLRVKLNFMARNTLWCFSAPEPSKSGEIHKCRYHQTTDEKSVKPVVKRYGTQNMTITAGTFNIMNSGPGMILKRNLTSMYIAEWELPL